MASPGPQSAVQLLGRERECAAIDRVLADAGCGVGGALVVRGEAGIGKSAMLEYAVQRVAPGMLGAASEWRGGRVGSGVRGAAWAAAPGPRASARAASTPVGSAGGCAGARVVNWFGPAADLGGGAGPARGGCGGPAGVVCR